MVEEQKGTNVEGQELTPEGQPTSEAEQPKAQEPAIEELLE